MKYQNRIIRSVYFVTTTVVDWIDVFTRPVYKHIILDSFQYTDILRDFKKFTSKKIIETLQQDHQESRKQWILRQFEYAGRNDWKIK